MRKGFGLKFILVPVLLWSGIAKAIGTTSNDLVKAKTVYIQRLQEINREGETAKTTGLTRYRNGLDALRQSVKQKGDLEGVRAVDVEISRFATQMTLPLLSASPATADLATWITTSRDAIEKAELDRASKIVQFTEQYFDFLDRQAKQAVREDKLDLAMIFKNEIDATKQTPAYQAACFAVEEKRSRTQVPQSETGKPGVQERSPPDSHTTDQVSIPVSTSATAPSEQFVGTQKEETRRVVPSKTPHILKGIYDVPKGRTLQIAAGCVFLAEKEGLLNVNGILVVEGTADQPVVFKGQRSGVGSWKGLRFDQSEPSAINYAQIQGAEIGLTINKANPAFEGCVIANCKTGVTITERQKPVFKNCLINGNDGNGIQMHISYAILDHCTITGNKGFGIFCDYYGEPVIESSIIKDNTEGGIRGSGYDHRIEAHNSIVFGNRGSDVVVLGPADWDFTGNWWGNANTQKLTAQGDTANLTCIQDAADSTGKGRVKLADFLRVAPTNCGASVVKFVDDTKSLRPSKRY